MVATALDTLKFAQAMQAAGMPKEQAEAQARVLADVLAVNFDKLVTQEHFETGIRDVESRLGTEIREVEQRLNAKIDLVAAKLGGEMMLLKWMMGVSLTLMVAILVRLFFFHSP